MTSSIFFASSELQTVGGMQQQMRNTIEAFAPHDVDVVEYATKSGDAKLSSNVRTHVQTDRRALFVARVARAFLSPKPRVFVFGHLGLLRALTGLPKQPRHRVVCLPAGMEAWYPQHKGVARVLHHVDHFVFTTPYTERMFTAFNRSSLKGNVQTSSIPLSLTKALEERTKANPLPTGEPRCVYVSRLTKDEPLKGLSDLLRAMKLLPKFRLDVVGSGDGRESYEREAQAIGVADRILFHGGVSDERRSETLRSADVLCLPSAQEGFGLVFLEALLAGRPCVGSMAGAVPNVLSDETGALAPFGNIEALAAAIQRTSERLRSGALTPESLRSYYDQHFTWELFRARYSSFIEKKLAALAV